MIFEIDNIELYFSEKQILNGVYLKAETGKITGILGSNGSGKSSLLNIFFGKLQPRHKLIRVDKKPHLKPLFRYGLVKYLPQHNFTPPNMKLTTGFKLLEVNWCNFTEQFPEFEKFSKESFRNLSGGERRFVEIWMCLKSPSQLVLLDEPFSHLSPVLIEKLKKTLDTEKRNKAIVITDHMYRHIIDTTDQLYLLKNGSTQLIRHLRELEDYKYLNTGSL